MKTPRSKPRGITTKHKQFAIDGLAVRVTVMDMASACLAGVKCRYDGGDKTDPEIRERFLRGEIIPFCPEILGSLTVPRSPMKIEGGNGADVLDGKAKPERPVRVVNESGDDPELLTEALIKGAKKSAAMATAIKPEKIYLKSKSLSCGVSVNGVTAELLKRAGTSGATGFTLVEI